MLNPRSGAYGGGYGDFFGYRDLLAEWRAGGDFEGWELDRGRRQVTVVSVARASTGGARRASAPRSPRSSVARACSSSPSTRASRSTARPGAVAPRRPPRSGSSTPAGRPGRRTSRSPTTTRSARSSPELVDEFGALDAVVNVAGISRPTGFACGVEDDWRAVLDVHLDGYLNVLRGGAAASWPRPATAAILGVTSGSGWRAADAGRLQLRQAGRRRAHLADRAGDARAGVTVNALSPIAATRMVLGRVAAPGRRRQHVRTRLGHRRRVARSTRCRRPSTSGRSARTSPARLRRVARRADHVLERRRGSRGWSRRASSRWRAPTRRRSLPPLLDDARSDGARAGRGGADEQRRREPASRHRVRRGPRRMRRAGRGPGAPSSSATTPPRAPRSATRSARAASSASASVRGRGRRGPARAGNRVRRRRGAARRRRPRRRSRSTRSSSPSRRRARAARQPTARRWQRVLDEHAGITDRIAHRRGVGARGVRSRGGDATGPSGSSPSSDATTAGGRSRAQAAAQLSRAAHTAPRPTGSTPSRSAWRARRPRRRAAAPRSRPTWCAAAERGRAVGRRARRRRRVDRPAQPSAPGRGDLVRGSRRPRLGRRRAPRHGHRRSTPIAARGGIDGRTHRAHRRRAHPPLGSGSRRLVPVPGRPAGARHGRRLGDVPPVRPAHVLLGVGELERREVRARRRRDRAVTRATRPRSSRRWPRRPGTRTRSSAASCRPTPSPTPSDSSTSR